MNSYSAFMEFQRGNANNCKDDYLQSVKTIRENIKAYVEEYHLRGSKN